MQAPNVTTLGQLLEHRARTSGMAPAMLQLGNDGGIVESRTFLDLHRNALRLGSILRERADRGDRVILAPAAPIAFVEGFFGLLCAGLTPVPAPAPRTESARRRIEAQAADCEARLAFVAEADLRQPPTEPSGAPNLEFVTIEALAAASPAAPAEVAHADTDDTAFLQYTSGSTSTPRGAMITHRSVLTNERQIAAACVHDESTVFGNWLPLFHDMGLIGGVLQPFCLGVPAYHLTPLQFHARPARWLKAIGRYGITTTGGPNFAYDACVDRIPEGDRDFDLSSWKVAFNGSEPVSARTLRRFAETFERQGFRPSTFLPCYGMAEATLFVSGGPAGSGRVSRRVSQNDEAVSCGLSAPGITCRIASPETGTLLAEGTEGEILIAGENVSKSYWRERPEDRAARFTEHAINGRTISFLRSGDLGYLSKGELYVTGRIKDLIIREGRNYHPSDLEISARKAQIPGARKNNAAFATAAFSTKDGSIVILIECAEADPAVLDPIAKDIRRFVLNDCGVQVDTVCFVMGTRLPMTTSGKIRRRECLRLFESGGFAQIHVDTLSSMRGLESMAAAPERFAVVEFLLGFLSRRLGRPAGPDDLDCPATSLGLDSMDAVALGMDFSQTFGIAVSAATVLSAARLSDLVDSLAASDPQPGRGVASSSQIPASSKIPPTAEALLLLWEREPARALGNVSLAFELPAHVSQEVVENALARLIREHRALRSCFRRGPDGFTIAAEEPPPPRLQFRNATPGDLPRVLAEAASTRFELFTEAPLRVHLYIGDGMAQTIQFVMHHAAIDLWSVSIVMADFFRGLAGGPGIRHAEPPFAFRRFFESERDAARSYWKETLPEPVQLVRLPIRGTREHSLGDSIKPPGRSIPFEIGIEDTTKLTEYARSRQCSLVTLLLAAYQSALATYTGERKVITALPFHGRGEAGSAKAVGCFVNPLPVVTHIGPGDSLDTIVEKVRNTILHLLAIDAVPVSEAGIETVRDRIRNPLLQFAFAPQNAGTEISEDVMVLAMRGFDRVVCVEGLEVRPRSVDAFEPAAELLFTVARFRGMLAGAFEYDVTHVPVDFAAGVAALTTALLRRIAADSSCGARAAIRVDPEEQGWSASRVLAGPTTGIETRSVLQLIHERRKSWNDANAIEHNGVLWSYEDLFARAGIAAANLRRQGVRFGDRVAVVSEITPAGIALMLGLWWCGAAYCPVDPLYPAERRQLILDALAARMTVTDPEPLLEATQSMPALPMPDAEAIAGLPAYAIFTSGSTGRPRGVLIPHRALANTVGAQRIFDIDPGVRVLQACSPGFDASIFEIVLALAFGGTLVLPERRSTSSASFTQAWEQLRPDVAVLPPSIATSLVGANWSPRTLILAGEPCPPALVAALASRCRLYNAYGPTETAIWATVERLDRPDATPYIGRPIDGVTVAVVDENLRPLPRGAPGELAIGGAGISMGYIDEPALTAARFVRAHDGELVYRTGDRAVITPGGKEDGKVDFLGRLDRQLKVNGVRIEPGEIEAVIQKAHGVAQAVVVDFPSDTGTRIAAFVATEGSGVDEASLRRHIARFLPAAFMPAVIEFRDRLPTGAHGKADLKVLRSLILDAEASVSSPRGDLDTPLLGTIADICKEVFGAVPRSPRDNLLMLGVHSLNAARFVSRLSRAVRREIPVSLVFERPVLEDFAAGVETAQHIPDDDSEIQVDGDSLASEYPLTPIQRDIWYLGESGHYKDYLIALAFRIAGPLNAALLRRAFAEVVRSHPSLRAVVIDHNGEPWQSFRADPDEGPGFIEIPGSFPSADDVRRDMDNRLARCEESPDYQLRTMLYRMREPERFVFGLIGHHLFLDGWSMGSLLDDLGRRYDGLVSGRAEASMPNGERALRRYLAAQDERGQFGSKRLDGALQKWRELLGSAERGSAYLPDRNAASQPGPPHTVSLSIHPSRRARLSEAARANNVSLFSLVTAAMAAVTASQQGDTSTVLSVLAANRAESWLEPVIGCLATTLPIPIEILSGVAVEEFWQDVHSRILAAQQIAGPPISAIGAALPGQQIGVRSPLLSTMIVQSDRFFHDLRLGETAAEPLPWRFAPAPKADLLLEVIDDQTTLGLRLETDPCVLSQSRTERIMEALEHVLGEWADGVRTPLRDFEVLSPGERELVVNAFNATERPYDLGSPLHRLVEAAADRWPDACAVLSEGVEISYGAFEKQVNRLANALIEAGVRVGTPVGVCSPPGLGLIVALHGVMKAGGAYVPLDPAYPTHRLEWLAKDCGIHFIVGESLTTFWRSLGLTAVLDPLNQQADDNRPAVDVNPGDTAYVLFTSGSTGKPKAAINRHESIVNRLLWMQETMPLAPGDRVLQKTSFAFDVSVWEFFWPLITGATVCTLRLGQNLDAAELYGVTQRDRISTIHFVPSALTDFLQSRATFDLPDLRRLILSGEELTPALRDMAFGRLNAEVHNLYGPAEAAVDVTHWRCGRDDGSARVPIGVPIANTQIYILDRLGHPAPIGAPGEIFIGGIQVGSGYLGNEEETRKRFGRNPFKAEPHSQSSIRLYRTGDAGRWTDQGSVEFLGRLDDQLKIRGIRVEPAEIIAAMKELPGVADATVLVQGVGSQRRLTGFVVPTPEGAINRIEMRRQLAEWLPAAMIPSAIVPVSRLPLRSSGKIDTAALARLAIEEEPLHPVESASSEMEQAILAIWCELLDRRNIGVTDNFFDAGGNSALLMQVQTRLARTLQRSVRVVDLLEHPTVRKLSDALAREGRPASGVAPNRSEAVQQGAVQEGRDRLARLASLRRNRS